MTRTRSLALGVFSTLACGLMTGCTTPSYTTSPYHPGPDAGRAVGAGIGLAVGETAGTVVGMGEGIVGGAAAPFDTTTHLVRIWHTETTADGRTIQVPEDILVDSLGRPVTMPRRQPAPVAPPPAPAVAPVPAAPVAPPPAPANP